MLHTNEVRILLPEKIQPPSQTPFILSVGPTLTMALPIVLMSLLGSGLFGRSGSYMYMTLIMGGTGCLMGALWGILNYIYRKRDYKNRVEKSKEEFDRYLLQTRQYLEKCVLDNREHMLMKYPSSERLLMLIDDAHLYKRYSEDEDYLFIRLALGEIPFQMKVVPDEDRKEMFPSEEVLKAKKLAGDFQTIKDVPVGINLRDSKCIGLCLEKNIKINYEYILSIIVQMSFSISPAELAICVIYDASNKYQQNMVSGIKFLPHVFSEGVKMRLISGNADTLRIILPELERLLEEKRRRLILFILEDSLIREEMLYRQLLKPGAEYPFNMFIMEEKRHLPNGVRTIIDKETYEGIEGIDIKNADRFSRSIRGLGAVYEKGDESIPQRVDFLTLFNARRIEEIDIASKWAKNRTFLRMKVPIGKINNDTLLYLDIHEKFHGPHGLIAGTTGSGKSELIQTYIMSLCISFSPAEVNFFLIDYKGGGTGNYISELPHCAGCISNLSGRMIQRAMDSIVSENRRRQALLLKYGVNHIDKYMELYNNNEASEPMPHLVLIVDEFAELKKEEPDFMQQVISLSAIGRSLGIHLILATQKPAGVVDDKIRSNAHFKLCLKVQDRQDSMDMLHRPEASLISNAGMCYLQIGNDEYFEKFQTGYCGGMYYESQNRETGVMLLDEAGGRRGIEGPKGAGINKLEKLVHYVNLTTDTLKVGKAKKLWMAELSEKIALNDMEIPIVSEKIAICVADDTLNQNQPVIYFNPVTDGHMAVGGGPSSGKSTLLKTMMSQIKPGDEFLLADLSKNMPVSVEEDGRCLGILSEGYEIPIFFFHLKREFQRRRESHKNRLFIFIDNISALLKLLSEKEREFVHTLAAEGAGVGITIVASGNSMADFTTSLFGRFKTTLALEMNDRTQYGDMLRRYNGIPLIRQNTPGRCLCKLNNRIMECQIILSGDISFPKVSCGKGRKFPKVPRMPLTGELLKELKPFGVPLGYSQKTGYIKYVDISGGGAFIISGNANTGRHILLEHIETAVREIYKDDTDVILKASADNPGTPDEIRKIKVMLLEDTGELLRELYGPYSDRKLRECYEEISQNGKEVFIFAICNPQKDIDIMSTTFFKNILSSRNGIHLGGMLTAQRIFEFEDIGYSEANRKMPKGIGYMKSPDASHTIRLRLPNVNDTDLYDEGE